MFVGHLTVGLLGKEIEPKVSLGMWFTAALLADLLFFPLLLAGIETVRVVPGATVNRVAGDNISYSHSLVSMAILGLAFAGAYFLWRRNIHGAVLLFAAVMSHWPLDMISHRPDMRLVPNGDSIFGFGLWNSLPATLVIEGGTWLLALVVFCRFTLARNWAGKYAFWVGAAVITLFWYTNINSSMDPDVAKAGVGGIVVFSLMIAWGYWMNRARPVVELAHVQKH